MDRSTLRQAEIDRNFDYFQRHVRTYMPEHAGEYALLRHRALIDFYQSVAAADDAGRQQFPDGIYSVQKVDDEPIDLGWFSHVAV